MYDRQLLLCCYSCFAFAVSNGAARRVTKSGQLLLLLLLLLPQVGCHYEHVL